MKTRASHFTKLTLCVLAFAFAVVASAPAQDADDQYLSVYYLMRSAEGLEAKGDNATALERFKEARIALLSFQRTNVAWNTKLVAHRLNYLTEKISPPVAPVAATTATATAPAGSSAAKAGMAVPQVKLIDAGAEPRQMLRLKPASGDKQIMAMTMKMDMDMKIGEMAIPAMNLPVIKMGMESNVKSVSAEGDIDYTTVITEASLAEGADTDSPAVAAMKTAIEDVKGLSVTGTMSSRGFNKGLEMKAPAEATPQMEHSMEQMRDSLANIAAPLPEEAVGPGAKWEVKQQIKSQGLTIDQTANYELISVEDNRATMKSTVTQSAGNQTVQNPAMPGMKMKLLDMSGNGSGTLTYDLAHLLPGKAAVDFHSETSMEMKAGGEKQLMSINMDLVIGFETK